jgi:hypothetical protein
MTILFIISSECVLLRVTLTMETAIAARTFRFTAFCGAAGLNEMSRALYVTIPSDARSEGLLAPQFVMSALLTTLF